MHELFSDWYQTVDPTATRETISKRWTATEELLASITKDNVAELAGHIARSALDAPAWFRRAYKTHDELMPTRGREEEFRVLAAIVLRIAIDREDEVAVAAALSLLTGAFGMKDEPNWLKEHLHAAAEGLSKAGRTVRRPAEPISVASPLTAEDVNAALSSAQNMIDAVAEGNDYLWWAFTKHSRLLNEAYNSLPVPIVAIAAPADIFGFVRTVPTAPETETLLLHVLLETPGARGAEFSFKNYMSGLGREHAQQIVQEVPTACSALCPVMWAVSAMAVARTWQVEFEKLFGFRTAVKFPVQAIAVQFLRELCLVSTFSKQG